MVSDTKFPNIDSMLLKYSLTSRTSNLEDPIMVKKQPPLSVLQKISKIIDIILE